MAHVLIQNVKKVFDGGVVAVNKANLHIKDKEFMVIVGPSGCGKTTMLRMIAGLEEITEGNITIEDRLVNNVPPKDRDIAMVFQNYALYPHMTVFDNMAFGLKLRKFPKNMIKQRVDETAKLLGIDELLKRKPKALSGGQQQRVALGRAIVRNPKAFLFDEPLSNLDAKLRVTTRAELKALHHRLQTTSIYVTHDQAEAMTLGDRICVMYNGKIQQVAPPMEVYDKPVNKFVAGFLGTPPMNFFSGKISYQSAKPMFVMCDGTKIAILDMMDFTAYDGKDMVMGIRPEHLMVRKKEHETHNQINSKVEIIEPLGDRKDVYLISGSGEKFIANVDPHVDIEINEKISMYFDSSRIHIFEPGDTGRNILINPGTTRFKAEYLSKTL